MIGLSNLLPKVPVAGRKKSKLRSSAATTLYRFSRDTDGNMSVMAIIAAMMMLVYGGMGIDLMYAEVERTRLQATLDRAVLAAADLEQRLEPQVIVDDYLQKMGLDDADILVTPDSGLNYRNVSAEGERIFPAKFLQLIGVDNLKAAGNAAAEERISNIEISLVLDVSGSMGQNERIDNLKVAATEFVETVLKDDQSGLTTINIVPYNATVNLGPTMSQYYDLTDEHDTSTCAIFPDSAFYSRGIDPNSELQRLAHFDPYTLDQNTVETPSSWCPLDEENKIIAQSDSEADLTALIDTFQAGGNTAIDLGMKWGVALLDPSARPVVNSLASDGHTTPDAVGRPADYTAEDAMKIVVLMTDGMNTTQYDLSPEYTSGMSNIWIDDRGDSDPYNDRFSHRVSEGGGSSSEEYYWVRFENDWRNRYQSYPDGGNDARRMTNAEVFARWGTRAFGQKFFRRPYYDNRVSYNEYYNAYYAYETIVSNTEADSRLSRLCAETRDADVTIFSIGFEAPDQGQAAMRDCASSPSHYFPVEGLEISDAFQAIARTINQLRLTQ